MRAVEIEKHKRFSKPRRETILGLHLVHGPAGVSDQRAILVMNWDNKAPRHGDRAAVVSDAKLVDGFGLNATLC